MTKNRRITNYKNIYRQFTTTIKNYIVQYINTTLNGKYIPSNYNKSIAIFVYPYHNTIGLYDKQIFIKLK